MSLLRGNVKITIASLRSTKWRSFLTMTGIIIGIVSVVTVVGIGEGVKREVAGQINQFGQDLITVRPGEVGKTEGKLVPNTDLLFGLNSLSGLTENDLRAVEASDHVRIAAPLSVVPGEVEAEGRKLQNSLVLATNEDLPAALNQKVPYGEFFAEENAEDNVAVMGRSAAQALFQDFVPLGKSFTFRGQTFIVRGMFADFKGTPLSPTSNFNNAIFIPSLVGEKLTGNSSQMYSILVKPDDTKNTGAAIASIDKNLLKVHGGEHDFTVMDQDQSLAASSDVLNLLTTMIAAVAAISLLVGGVGIMNIMLATVTERMHEIGVRKAIGATNRQILQQFMLESIVLSLVGGVVGVIISVLTVLGMKAYTSLDPVVSWQAIVIAVGTSLVIGVVFGTAPAVKAASKDPIEALRHE
ncbi:MAG TPA: ABC transporter permease [Candidatus Saccharimonadales bacterium]|nr:ABC transporter permease [Candidatus Saccharimonadales bacterium]